MWKCCIRRHIKDCAKQVGDHCYWLRISETNEGRQR